MLDAIYRALYGGGHIVAPDLDPEFFPNYQQSTLADKE